MNLAQSRMKLALQVRFKLKGDASNHAYSWVFQPKLQDRLGGNLERGHLAILMRPHFDNLGVGTVPVSQSGLQKFASWDQQHPSVFLDLAQ